MKQRLNRRGFELGEIDASKVNQSSNNKNNLRRWKRGQAIFLRQIGAKLLCDEVDNLARSQILYETTLQHHSCETIIDQPFYTKALEDRFEFLGTSQNQGSQQEIETLYFDAIKAQQTIAEDLWIKVSRLSYFDGDQSIRYRFSFGEDFEEDVAADNNRQTYAAELTDLIFPESKVITQNNQLLDTLNPLVDGAKISFVERIIYFNAPQGGAYLHHDFERGHSGVVYAQISGQSFWLALPKNELITHVTEFVEDCHRAQKWPASLGYDMISELMEMSANKKIADELDTFANSTLIHLINETAPFVQKLIKAGCGFYLSPGDMMLLPQENQQRCCWHSVFSIGEIPGEALSFAMRAD